LPISRNTVKKCIFSLINDVTNQIQIDYMTSAYYFSICLDINTDVALQARLAVFVRFSIVNVMK